MIQEAYCSFKVAKLLKEKGFDGPCQAIWYEDRIILLAHIIDNNNLSLTAEYKFSMQKDSLITIPTHQMAIAWLREVHHIFVEISTHIDLNGKYLFSYAILDSTCNYIRRGCTDYSWKYEDTVEAALKYAVEKLL